MTHVIQERAMLVNLTISSWTASKKDQGASRQVKQQHAASDKAGWYNKRLIDPTALEPINRIAGRARDYHYKMTLPWGDNGDRILPAPIYMEYMDNLREFRTKFDAAVGVFVRDYPALVQSARVMLGTMYSPGDYPEAHLIKQRFDMRISFNPVADAADFRVDVGIEAVNEIRQSIEASVAGNMRSAIRECWIRLDEVVGKMHRTLDDPETVFRDSLVENTQVLVEIIPKLNIMNDKQLDDIVHKTARWLVIEPDQLRRDKKLRAATASKAYEIWQEIASWVKTEAFQVPTP